MEKTVVFFIANKDFKDVEYLEPKEILVNQGVTVKTISSAEEAVGVEGTKIEIDANIREVIAEDYDGIIIAGGQGISQYFQDSDLLTAIKNFNQKGKLVAAICWAPEVLAHAGVLKGKRATVWPGAKEAIVRGGALYLDEEVVVDDNIITAAGPAYATKFGEAIAGQLVSK